MSIHNLYLEKLKRMTDEELNDEVKLMGKIMERHSPMTKEEKERAKACFSFVMNLPNLAEEEKNMLKLALKVLRYL